MKHYFAILLFFICISLNANDNLMLGIVPQPVSVKITSDQFFQISKATTISYQSEAIKVAQYLVTHLKKSTGYEIPKGNNNAEIRLVLIQNKELKNEAYSIISNEKGIEITANTTAGLFYGVQTFLQILPPEIYSKRVRKYKQWKIPFVIINDYPLFSEFRGMQLDISRHFRTKEEILEIIDIMAYHKLNSLHLHLSDDEGWRIEIKKYPLLTEISTIGNKDHVGSGKREYLKQEEICEIINYAKDRFIQIFPEVDMPGHMHAIIRAYPELASPKDSRIEKRVIRIDEAGYLFCKNILTEIDSIFNSKYIHLGFDEVNLGCEIYNDKEITDFSNKMTKFVKDELKKTPILWDDAFEKGYKDNSSLIQWWRNGKNHWWSQMELTIDDKLQQFDQPYIISNAKYTYFDMAHQPNSFGAQWAGSISVAEIYNWRPYKDLVNYNPSKRDLARGIICATWSENITNYGIFQKMVYPRLAAFSEKGWALDEANHSPSWTEYRDKILLKKQLKRYNAMKLNYWGKYNPLKYKRLPDSKK